MYSFLLCIVALVLGYVIYGKFISRVFGPDPSRVTPAVAKNDGIDFVPMPAWKVYMVQFLNIAGTGPIFGAIMGAKFGPSSYLWIVLGSIFAGAVHDYFTGMLSLRNDGAEIPDIAGKYLGEGTKKVMMVFSVILLLLVGAVFVYSPAINLAELVPIGGSPLMAWVIIVFVYYVIATLMPIDKIIGRFYPIFAIALIFMAVALFIGLLVKWPSIPELTQGLGNRGAEIGFKGQQIFPCLFITIACGAISGFHATQSPLMARCLKNEKLGRPVFFGAMITEGLIALIWAAVSSYFFFDGGAAELGADLSTAAPAVVTKVAHGWLGTFGAILAILGVVAAPITSGDTAFRSARLIIGDWLHLDQSSPRNRLRIAIPMFVAGALLLFWNLSNEDSFNAIWGYFGWANQTLASFTLWTITAFLLKERKKFYYLITLLPAIFMTSVSITYLLISKWHLIPSEGIPYVAFGTAALSFVIFEILKRRSIKRA